MSVPKAIVALAHGFEEIETVTIIDVLRRGGVHVTVAGIGLEPQKGSRRVEIVPEITLSAVVDHDFDIVILPGGKAGVLRLIEDGTTLEILKKAKKNGKYIAAICAAPLALHAAGIIDGVKLTSYPGLSEDLVGADYLEDRIVVDGKLITSRSPGTAMDFALKIVDILMGREKADRIAELMLYAYETA